MDENHSQRNGRSRPAASGAHELAGFGWRVIPLHNIAANGKCSCGEDPCTGKPGKHPRAPHGSRDGTTDAETIRRWWESWPEANPAVCTGGGSGVFVVGPDGQAGIDALADLERQHGPLPRTPTVETGGGGRHHYFRWPADGNVRNRRNHRGLPIDVRGEGGYALAPPSRNANGPYVWTVHPSECEVAEAPPWLLEWCRSDGKASAGGAGAKGERPRHRSDGTSITDRAINYLATMPPAVSGQGGHDTTLTAARIVVWGFDLGPDFGFRLLWDHYNPRCEPPWSERELRHKCEEANTVPYDKPRGWLLEQRHRTNGAAHRRNGRAHAPEDGPEEEEGDVELATAADLIRVNATVRWLWPQWIPVGVLTILASDAGVGKTRFCADLLRRIHNGEPWPDGTPATLPPGSRAMWVAADNQHPELGSLPAAFGFPPEALVLNTTVGNPFGGTMLDSPGDLRRFERHIERAAVPLVFIDTCLNATERSAHKPEDAAAFFKPLQEIAARRQVGMMALTHLNANGTPLGRRIVAQGRVVMQLERPDPEGQPHRRKLHVTKSNSLYPPALGVTMEACGNQYDSRPPCPPESEPGAKDAPKTTECMDWLRNCLGPGQGVAVHKVRQAAEDRGFSGTTLYRAMGRLGVEEYRQQGKKWWRLAATDDEK